VSSTPLRDSQPDLEQLAEEANRCELRLVQSELTDDEFMDLIEELRAIRRRMWSLMEADQN